MVTGREDLATNSNKMVSAVLMKIADFPTTPTTKIVVVVIARKIEETTTAAAVGITISPVDQETKFVTNLETLETAPLVTTANSAMMSVEEISRIKATAL